MYVVLKKDAFDEKQIVFRDAIRVFKGRTLIGIDYMEAGEQKSVEYLCEDYRFLHVMDEE